MTVAGETHRCPPHEVLAAFVDAKLPKTQVVALTEHLTTCAECRFVVESASELQAEEQEESIAPRGGRAWQQIAVAAVIGAVVLSSPFAWTKWQTNKAEIRELATEFMSVINSGIRTSVAWVKSSPRTYRRETAVRELVAVADTSNVRIIEPRVSGFGYGPPPRVYRGEKEETTAQLIIFAKAIEVIENTKGDQSSEASHSRGIAYLVSGGIDDAKRELTAATSTTPNDARAWSDLAAARYVARDYAGARYAANRALIVNPNLIEARFNRALATSRLQPAESIKEWNEYLKHDKNSQWAMEARQRIKDAQNQ